MIFKNTQGQQIFCYSVGNISVACSNVSYLALFRDITIYAVYESA